MNQFVQVVTHPVNIPCVHPTRVINRDLSGVTSILASFRREVFKPGFKPAFQVPGSNNPTEIIEGIEERVTAPWSIDQAGASLCGPAAFMYCLAKDAPEIYAQYVCDLYLAGNARIGALSVEPSNACRNGRLQVSSRNGETSRRIEVVDWIALASLRDSENTFYRHRSVTSDVSGITMPGALTDWFSAAGYRQVHQNTQVAGSAGTAHFLRAANYYQHNKNVCLFIAAKVKSGPFTVKAVPNHWVVLSDMVRMRASLSSQEASKQTLPEQQVPSVIAYNWGREKDQLNLSRLTLGEFSKYYFGYVVAG